MAARAPIRWTLTVVTLCAAVAVFTCAVVTMLLSDRGHDELEQLQSRISTLENNIKTIQERRKSSTGSERAVLKSPLVGGADGEVIGRLKREAPAGQDETGNPQQGRPEKKKKKGKGKRRRGEKKHRKRTDGQLVSLDAVHFESVFDNSTVKNTGEGEVYDFWRKLTFGEHRPASFIKEMSNSSAYTITEGGLYFIYAQVLFVDHSERFAYGIFVDDRLAFQCAQSQAAGHAPDTAHLGPVAVQCHTGAVLHIGQGQSVYIKSLYQGREVRQLGPATFWGIVKFSSL